MNVRKLSGIGMILALSAAAVTACGSSSPTASGGTSSTSAPGAAGTSGAGTKGEAALQALYQQAVKAGQTTVVIYGPTAGTDAPMYKAFEKEFPKITISGVPIVGPPMSAKLQAEFSSGKHVGDIAYTGNTNMLQYAASGWFAPFDPVTAPTASDSLAETAGPNKDFYGVSVTVAGAVYNTNLVKSPPTSWTDFLDTSAYKGKIAMYDPTAIGLMEDIFAHMTLVSSLSGVEPALSKEDPDLVPGTNFTGPIQAVASGSKAIALGTSYGLYLPAKAGGAPVGFTLFKTDNYTVTTYMGIIKGGPDPLAAELYESWAFTPDAATAIGSEGEWSTNLSNGPPPGEPGLSSISQFPAIPLSQIVAADNDAIKKAGTYFP